MVHSTTLRPQLDDILIFWELIMTTEMIKFSEVITREEFKSGQLYFDTPVNLREYFLWIKDRFESGEQYPYDLEELVGIAFMQKVKAVEALKRDFTQPIDFISSRVEISQIGTFNNKRIKNFYKLAPHTFGYLVAKRCLPVFEIFNEFFDDCLKGNTFKIKSLKEKIVKEKIVIEDKRKQPFMQHVRINKYMLYVVLFDHGVIKIGKGINAINRVNEHARQARIFGRKMIDFFIEEKPLITEEDLIRFCNKNGTLYDGNEYFTDLNYNAVVSFVRRKVERKILKLVH